MSSTPSPPALPRGERGGSVDPGGIHRAQVAESLCQGVDSQNTRYRDGVDDLAAERQTNGLGDRIPPQGDVRFLLVRLWATDLGEPGGQVDPYRFVAEPGRGVQVDQHLPAVSYQPGFLPEFACGSEMWWLTADIEQPGGQLPQSPAQRMAVLVDHRDVPVFVHRHRSEERRVGKECR